MTVEQDWIRPEGRALLVPGTLSPRRPVPAHIERPEYVGKDEAVSDTGPFVQSADVIARVREASRVAALALQAAGEAAQPGVTTDHIDAVVHDVLLENGAYPSTLGYLGFEKSCCTSLNEVICHGIPDDRPLQDGDIVKIDITAFVDGVHGDNCATFLVGEVAPEVRDLVTRTEEAMHRGIKAALPGREVNVIGRVIERYARRFGYGVVRDYTGHGIGETFHSGLVIPHYDAAPAHADVIEPGMTFTVEPMLDLGTPDWIMWDDEWTVVTADGSWSAQFENTILITESGPEILTRP